MNHYIYALCAVLLGNTIYIQAESSQKGFEFYRKRAELKPISAGPIDITAYSLLLGGTAKYGWHSKSLSDKLISGAFIGALTLPVLYQYMKTSKPAWREQMRKFNEKDFAKPIVIGQKNYQVSREFDIISNIHGPKGYEFYFMPQDGDIAVVYQGIIDTLKLNNLQNYINLVAIRLTPGVTYSNRKALSRIIVQLKEDVQKDKANEILTLLYNATNSFPGIGKHPRYSKALTSTKNNLIYTAYGSSEYKEVYKPKDLFIRKTGIFWNAPDDMAYQNEDQELSLYASK
ncbi:MAG TPA: hypothetical protein VGW78_02065 [Candidatus Babeliales bacterium]|nr:hypothetical protein [Candidatus Babeliales bacterium]